MKLILGCLFGLTLILVMPQAFAELEGIELESNFLSIQFGDPEFKHYPDGKIKVWNTVYSMSVFGTPLENPVVKTHNTGFSIKDTDEGFIMFARENGDGYDATVFADGHWFTDRLTEPTSFEVPPVPQYVEPTPTIQLFTWMEGNGRVGDDFTVKVRVTDDENNRGMNIPGGGIPEAEVTIFTGQGDRALRSVTGTTNVYGVYNGSIFLLSTDYLYHEYMDVTVVVKWNDQHLSESQQVWLITSEGN